MKNSTFAFILRSARDRAGLSVAQLAASTGLTRATIHGLENGRLRHGKRVAVDPSWDVVVRLADALGISTEEFRTTNPERAVS